MTDQRRRETHRYELRRRQSPSSVAAGVRADRSEGGRRLRGQGGGRGGATEGGAVSRPALVAVVAGREGLVVRLGAVELNSPSAGQVRSESCFFFLSLVDQDRVIIIWSFPLGLD